MEQSPTHHHIDQGWVKPRRGEEATLSMQINAACLTMSNVARPLKVTVLHGRRLRDESHVVVLKVGDKEFRTRAVKVRVLPVCS